MKLFVYLLLMVIGSIVYTCAAGQDPEKYNTLYTKIYLEISSKDMPRAMAMADSLFKASTTPLYQTKSLMLSASLYQQQQLLTQASELAEEAYEIISTTSDYNWMVRISGFLATQYRMLQLYGKSKLYCDRALAMIQKINNPEMVNSTRGLIHQELAYNDLGLKNYHSSIKHIQESQKNFEHISQNKDFLSANNEQLLGLNYFHLADHQRSLYHYRKGLSLMSRMPENFIKGLCYSGIAAILIQKNDLPGAKRYLDSAGAVAGKSQHLPLKNEIYKTSQQYYLKVKDIASFEKIRQKQDSVKEQISSGRAMFLDHALIKLEKNNQEAQYRIRARNVPIAIATVIIILGGCFFLFYRKIQKRKYEKFMADMAMKQSAPPNYILPAPEKQEAPVDEDNNTQQDMPGNEERKTQYSSAIKRAAIKKQESPAFIPEETLQRLLTSLDQFEAQHLYTSANVSLSFLSTHLSTNSKYLSYVLKQYRQKDFTSYINDLRINYVIQKLKADPEWRKYKISVLAEKAGFSSHSKFTTIFKAYTGLSPSMFMQCLPEEAVTNPR